MVYDSPRSLAYVLSCVYSSSDSFLGPLAWLVAPGRQEAAWLSLCSLINPPGFGSEGFKHVDMFYCTRCVYFVVMVSYGHIGLLGPSGMCH